MGKKKEQRLSSRFFVCGPNWDQKTHRPLGMTWETVKHPCQGLQPLRSHD